VREISAAAVRIRAMRPKYDDEMLLGAGMLGVGGVVDFWGGVGCGRRWLIYVRRASGRADPASVACDRRSFVGRAPVAPTCCE